MASMDEDFHTDIGIEAIDLASLLCRFEEATSSMIDLKLCLQSENNKEIQVKTSVSKATKDSSIFPVRLKNTGRTGDRNTEKVHHSYTSILPKNGMFSNPGSLESALCPTKHIDQVSMLSFLSPGKDFQFIPTEDLRSNPVESWSSRSAKLVAEPDTSAAVGPQEPTAKKNILFLNELFPDDVPQCDTLTDAENHEPNTSLDELTAELFTESSVLSNNGAFEAVDIPGSGHGLNQLPGSDQDIISSSLTSLFGDDYGMSMEEFLNSHFNHEPDHVADFDSVILGHGAHHSVLDFDISDISTEFDHSYCSSNLLAVLSEQNYCSSDLLAVSSEQNYCSSDILSDSSEQNSELLKEPHTSITSFQSVQLQSHDNELEVSESVQLQSHDNELEVSESVQLHSHDNELEVSESVQLHSHDNELEVSESVQLHSHDNEVEVAESVQLQAHDNELEFSGIPEAFCDNNSFVASSPINTNEFILEDKEIFVDSDGNDLYSQDPTQLLETEKCQLPPEIIPKTAEKKDNRKRPHSCLQHHKHSTSSVSEDAHVFYDKIPSYYTALSIPLKPVTTTVFESTTKAIGTTDHLEIDTSEPSDEGHYDKVPAHRRCFTNTIKDVDIKCDNSESQDKVGSIIPTQKSMNNSAHETNGLALPFQSVLSCVENEEKHAGVFNSHYSKISGRRSRSTNRRSSSMSRFSRRSASSLSDCSTCSSCSNRSHCSTCSIFSRSSSSSGSESRSSRSRSPSPSRGNRYSSKQLHHHHYTQSKARRSRSRTVSPHEEAGWRSKQQHSYRSRHNSSMEVRTERRKNKEEEQARAMEERRIVYVGKIPDGYTKRQLYQRFQSFGEIKEVKLNFREHGDNYGFVTFAYACDAITAKEKGNSTPGDVKFDLCFGGRRHFCPDQYADLDGNREIEEEYAPMSRNLTEDLDYAALLKMHSTHQRKKVA
jgi:hypothetical protein